MVHVKLRFRDQLHLLSFLAFTHCQTLVVNHQAVTVSGCYSFADVAMAIDYLEGELLELAGLNFFTLKAFLGLDYKITSANGITIERKYS